MSATVFKKVDYSLANLVEYLKLGEIGLPDIQRPFVWKNAKVRDLFDSMYQGFPVGYLLFWQNGLAEDTRQIGADAKQKPARLLVVDGQQRLTSLYAVMSGVKVVRENYSTEQIEIAFNPLLEKFEVADAAIKRDKAYIPNISVMWSDETNLFDLVGSYLEALGSVREVSPEDKTKIQNSFSNLQGLTSFPFTALELSASISEEDVAEVFVRINSQGARLDQADFILTLMSVFWDEGRTELEKFCRDALEPSKSGASSYNHFIVPKPDQLLRVSVGVGFKRARLKYVYSLLRGKDLETEQFSDERRVEQFKLLQEAQGKALNLQYWHDYMQCLRMAGFRGQGMISSANNLLYSYVIYLLGRTEYGVEEYRLRRTMARWFFMANLTGRFTGSPESAMESDLAKLKAAENADGFVSVLEHACDLALTDDYWAITLPGYLVSSAAYAPALFAYHAALVLLDAPALFSKSKIADLLDPSIKAPKSAVERHHLFPKGYLKKLGIRGVKETNQIANFAYVEWGDNIKISDQAPADYLPEMEGRFSGKELERMRYLHALPAGWEKMEYQEFLEQRRELIAKVVSDGYELLARDDVSAAAHAAATVEDLVLIGESDAIEFKSTLRHNLHTGKHDPRMEWAILRTLAGFLNNSGGKLVIGVADDGEPAGLSHDGFANEDKMSLHLTNIVKQRMGPQAVTLMRQRFEDYNGERVMVVECDPAKAPVFVKDGHAEKYFIRTGPSTTELTASQQHDHISQRFSK